MFTMEDGRQGRRSIGDKTWVQSDITVGRGQGRMAVGPASLVFPALALSPSAIPGGGRGGGRAVRTPTLPGNRAGSGAAGGTAKIILTTGGMSTHDVSRKETVDRAVVGRRCVFSG
jgi:hypothetical protein